MTQLRVDQIRKLFENHVEITKTGYLKIRIYSMMYQKDNTQKLIDILQKVKEIPEYKDSNFDVSYETGYYDQVDDIYLEFSPKQ